MILDFVFNTRGLKLSVALTHLGHPRYRTDAQKLMFVGGESAKFSPREINHLRMEPAKGFRAAQSSTSDLQWLNPRFSQRFREILAATLRLTVAARGLTTHCDALLSH
jgi:hypothetical protein